MFLVCICSPAEASHVSRTIEGTTMRAVLMLVKNSRETFLAVKFLKHS